MYIQQCAAFSKGLYIHNNKDITLTNTSS